MQAGGNWNGENKEAGAEYWVAIAKRTRWNKIRNLASQTVALVTLISFLNSGEENTFSAVVSAGEQRFLPC